MTKYFLVPAVHFIGDAGNPEIRPKYCDELRLNWAGQYIPSLDQYVICTTTKDVGKHSAISANADVVFLDGKQATKDLLQSKFKIKKMANTDDDFETLVQLVEPKAKKTDFFVESD